MHKRLEARFKEHYGVYTTQHDSGVSNQKLHAINIVQFLIMKFHYTTHVINKSLKLHFRSINNVSLYTRIRYLFVYSPRSLCITTPECSKSEDFHDHARYYKNQKPLSHPRASTNTPKQAFSVINTRPDCYRVPHVQVGKSHSKHNQA